MTSGAVSGILGAYLVLYPASRVLMLTPVPLDLHEVPAPIIMAFYFVLHVAGGAAWLADAAAGFLDRRGLLCGSEETDRLVDARSEVERRAAAAIRTVSGFRATPAPVRSSASRIPLPTRLGHRALLLSFSASASISSSRRRRRSAASSGLLAGGRQFGIEIQQPRHPPSGPGASASRPTPSPLSSNTARSVVSWPRCS